MDINVTLTKLKKNFGYADGYKRDTYYLKKIPKIIIWKPRSEAEPQ